MAENARMRGDDLRYTQQQETYEHIAWLDQQLAMVEKVRTVFLEGRKKFLPVERERVHQLQQNAQDVPRVVKQGPAAS
jgi:phosphopantetheine adenylyltransferase